jgi:hypothetical protein
METRHKGLLFSHQDLGSTETGQAHGRTEAWSTEGPCFTFQLFAPSKSELANGAR